jgi:membrane-bound lytic murein transglycosylase F
VHLSDTIMMARTLGIPLIFIASICFLACGGERPQERLRPVDRDLPAIEQEKRLNVLFTFNSTGYFLLRGEPMGFEYELLRAFARDRELELAPVVVRDRDELFNRLDRGDGDVVAARLVRSADLETETLLSDAIYSTRPAVIQQVAPPEDVDLPEIAEHLTQPRHPPPPPGTIRARRVQSAAELGGREVHLERRSPYRENLIEISEGIDGDIEVIEVEPGVATEALIRQVSRGEIELTVGQENAALLRSDYFTNIEVAPAVGPERETVWAVRQSSPRLLEALNQWLAENEELRSQLYQKYFIDRRGYKQRVESVYLTSETGTLSPYDELFKRGVAPLGWDWRLLASQAYQESRFEPDARSWAGAEGLLQLMPGTAREVGVRNSRNPEENVEGAVRYLLGLTRRWEPIIADPDERLKFIFASYNAGPGHVDDARRLTDKHGGNSNVWEDVAYWMLQKSKRAVFNDPVVRHGFVRGLEPVTYVELILERYDHYREFVQE